MAEPGTAPDAREQMDVSAALREYSEMLGDIEGEVNEGVYLKVCKAGVNLHRARASALANSRLTLPGSETLPGELTQQHLNTVQRAQDVLEELRVQNQMLVEENDEYQDRLCAVLQRVDALESSNKKAKRSRAFYENSFWAVYGLLVKKGVTDAEVDAAYAAHGVLGQWKEQRERASALVRKRSREQSLHELESGSDGE